MDQRIISRRREATGKTIVVHHQDPWINKALREASWKLKAGGMLELRKIIKAFENKEEDMNLEDDGQGEHVREEFKGKSTKGLVVKYQTKEKKCSCKSFKISKFCCRHILFYRKSKDLAIFDIDLFPKSYQKNPVISEEDMTGDNLEEPVPSSPGLEYMIREQQNKVKLN